MKEITQMKTDNSLTILDEIPFSLDVTALLHRFHQDETFVLMDELLRIARAATDIGRPKGLFRLCAVTHTDDASIMLDGVIFSSRILRVNLEGSYRAFPFLATCGRELESWSQTLDDPMHMFWADIIKEMALQQAITALGESLAATYKPGEHAVMNPGSLSDWPIDEQRPLFFLFGKAAEHIGVELTASCLMSPVKSVSGIWFETEKGFMNCQLCPREECPNRRAPYDPHLFVVRYGSEQPAPRDNSPKHE